jgi:hypothetical protein
MGLTLLAQSHLPTTYWIDSFLTSAYLIDRLPTNILHNLSPFYMPKYSDLHVFGCSCYYLLSPNGKHKLCFKSQKCIFIVYSVQQKGYRCLDLNTGRFYISCNVIFDENSFSSVNMVSDSLVKNDFILSDLFSPFKFSASTPLSICSESFFSHLSENNDFSPIQVPRSISVSHTNPVE